MSEINGNNKRGASSGDAIAPLVARAITPERSLPRQLQRNGKATSAPGATFHKGAVPQVALSPRSSSDIVRVTECGNGKPPAGETQRASREAAGAWSAEAIAAAWHREDVARVVAEIEDAAAALRWQAVEEVAPIGLPLHGPRSPQPQVWLGVGGLWASIAAAAVGMLGGLVLLMR